MQLKNKNVSFFRTRTTLFCIVFFLTSEVSRAQIPVKLATSIAQGVVKAISPHATKKIMGELGLNQDQEFIDTLNGLKDAIESNREQLDQIVDLIREQDFTDAYSAAKSEADAILTEMENFADIKYNDSPIENTEVNRIKREILGHINQLATILNDPNSGLMHKFHKTERSSNTSNLNTYWEEFEQLRISYVITLAQAMATLEGVADYQLAAWKTCEGSAPASTLPVYKYEFVGRSNTACRAGTSGEGGPSDSRAQATSNLYFDTYIVGKNSEDSCQQRCLNNTNCVGIEYNAKSGRCELWKADIRYIQDSSYGYTCKRKMQKQVPPPMTRTDCDLAHSRVSDSALLELSTKVNNIANEMYEWGVPLIENRTDSKFIHVKNQPWALSNPTDFSGYFGTVTKNRLLDKLKSAAAGYDSSKNESKTLEQFFEENQVPTRFIDQSSWECKAFGTLGSGPGHNLLVRLNMVVGNNVSSPMVNLTHRFESYADCMNRLQTFKAQAGQDYQISNGKPIGGLHISSYWKNNIDCGDLDLCDIPSGKETVNRPFFGRFFTYNLTQDDCSRIKSKYGSGSSQFKYCGNRLNREGRAALMTQSAIDEYRK